MRNAFQFIGILLFCGLCGCPTGPSGPGGLPFAGKPGTPVSDEQRQAVIDSIPTMLAGKRADDPGAARDALIAKFQQDPTIEEAGISQDGSVWARFTDNRLLIVAMNNPTPIADDAVLPTGPFDKLRIEDGAAPAKATTAIESTAKPSRSHLDQKYSLPSSTAFHMLNGYDDDYNGVETHLSNLSDWLGQRGYSDQTSGGHGMTLKKLKSVQNAGLLYVHAHGGVGYLREDEADPDSATYPVYGLGTLTFLNDDHRSTDDKIQIDYYLKTRQLGYLIMPKLGRDNIEDVLRFRPIASTAYFITKDFVLNHMSFAPGSWVYVDACGSADAGFRDAFLKQGAGVVLGWSSGVRHLDAQETSEYLFSRLLGINSLGSAKFAKAESKPQRPFPLSDMLDDIDTRQRTNPPDVAGLNTSLRTSFSLQNVGDLSTPYGIAHLNIATAENVQDAMLLPTIQQLFIDDFESPNHNNEPNILTVAGAFGVETPHVYIGDPTAGGTELVIIENTSASIVCRVSGTAHGPVTVRNGYFTSPPRMLTMWSGSADVLNEDSSGRSPKESLQMMVRFRGDIQSKRYRPGETPTYSAIPTCDAIPDQATLLVATRFGTVPCLPPKTGAGHTWETTDVGNPPVKRAGDSSDAFMWFMKGGSGVAVNATTGVVTGSIAYGIFKKDGVHVTGNCTFEPPVDRYEHLNITGGVDFTLTPSSFDYDIDEWNPIDAGTLHSTSHVVLTAKSTPSDSDLR